MPPAPGVTVRGLLGSRPDALRPADRTAGRRRDGLDRLITSPHIQKTGLALAGFHEYLKPGRVLIFGESEIRYLESLETAARLRTAPAGADARLSLRAHYRRLYAAAGNARSIAEQRRRSRC